MFIVVDGLDGSGKTTIVETITELFENLGLHIIKTKAVGAGEMGTAIRKRILNSAVEPNDTLTTLGMLLCNYEMYSEVALPALAAGKSVITDRFLSSFIAHQEVAMNSDIAIPMLDLVFPLDKTIKPDLYIHCDVDVKTSIIRLTERKNLDNFDRKSLEFKKKTQESYLRIANNNPAVKTIILDCNRPLKEVLSEVTNKVNKEIDRRAIS